MNPIRRPRPWVLLVSVAALAVGLWLLLVPRIATYYVDDSGNPYDVEVKYAWGRGTSDQEMIMSSDLFAEDEPAASDGDLELVTTVRLNCGLVFTSGENESQMTAGTEVCSDVERPLLIGGLGLLGLGIAGFVVAPLLSTRRREQEPA